MNYEVTVPVIIFLIGAPISIIKSNFFERYEIKISKIRTAIIGMLEKAKYELVTMELEKRGVITPIAKKGQEKKHIKKGQEKNYDDFINFMQKSSFLKYANEHEEMLDFEGCVDKKLLYLALTIIGFAMPVITLQLQGIIFAIGFFWLAADLGIFLALTIEIISMIKRIDELYERYVIGKQSFGGYDL